MKFEITQGETNLETELLETSQVRVFDQIKDFDWMPQKDGSFTVKLDDAFYKLYNVQINGNTVSFQHKGHFYQYTVKDEMAILMEKMGFKDSSASSAGSISAPMPGKIVKVLIEVGDVVQPGQPVVILEAMKMENELKTTLGGTVKNIAVLPGQSVEKNELLLEIE
jgi:biotin carboxyl carrier protein